MRNHLAGFGVLAALAGSAITLPALAADMPIYHKAPPIQPHYAPVPVMLFNWTGFYVGGNLGYLWTNGSGNATVGGVAGPVRGDGSGFVGGGQLGFNYQMSSIVLGAELDFQGSGASGTVSGGTLPVVYSGTSKMPWFGTARGRVGYAFDNWMVYATGGVAFGETRVSGFSSNFGAFSGKANFASWTLGGGLETALYGNWSVKGEYLYLGSPSKVPVVPTTTSLSGSTSTHLLRTGVNYRF
ncbi:MAG TPA: outer membrane protein [Xanthobacteraceae bacterium]|nr:outer membrane protein [Xanthobacteraceae bacterium]